MHIKLRRAISVSIVVEKITPEQAAKITQLEEGQFADLKALEIQPKKLTKTISAFANSDGGDLYIGIDEVKSGAAKDRQWRGFADQEAANGHIQAFEQLFPLRPRLRTWFSAVRYPEWACNARPDHQVTRHQAIRKQHAVH